MALMAISFPLLPGQTEAWKAFNEQLNGPRNEEFRASRREIGARERTFLQQTPMGDVVVVTLEGDDPAGAFAAFTQRDDEFANWFLDEVEKYHGVDLRKPPEGPLPELIIDSEG